jgi:hypothetical protein
MKNEDDADDEAKAYLIKILKNKQSLINITKQIHFFVTTVH